jgi:ornithine carbamoyltransferase
MSPVPPPATAPKGFLSILDLSHEDLVRLLDRAGEMKAERRRRRRSSAADILRGQHVALLFEKPSLRTWSTFEIAVKELGGHTLHLPPESAEGVREPLADIARNLERWVAALVIRTFGQRKVSELAAAAPALRVINALTDEQHPCQALADVMTLRERWHDCRGRRIAFVGDGNNVAASLAHAAPMLGISVHLASPSGYDLPDSVVDEAGRVARHGAEVRRFRDPDQAVAGADAVYTDVWTSMGEEDESARRRIAFGAYQVNARLMHAAGPQAVFMHCLPAHRGEEVTSDVIESPASVVFDQAENRLHSQKALLALLLGADR